MTDKPIRDVAAAIMQDDEGRVLLLQRGPTAPTFPDRWGPVTGLVEAGETPAAAALREIAEELGVSGHLLRGGDPFLVDVDAFVVRVHPFLCRLEGDAAITLDDENTRFAWLTIEDALALPTIPALDEDLRQLGLL